MAKKKSTVSMPVLALRGLMVFPHMVLHFDVGRVKSVAALEEAMMGNQKVFLVAQQDADVDDPAVEELCRVGTVATVKQVMNLPGDSLRVLVEGEYRAELVTVTQEEPWLCGDIRKMEEKCAASEWSWPHWCVQRRIILTSMAVPASASARKL